jgi:predicted dehydrogenase
VDAVSIVVPTTAHLEAASPFLSAGNSGPARKAIAATLAGGSRSSAWLGPGCDLQIGHVERFNAGVMALAQRIQAPVYLEAQRMGGSPSGRPMSTWSPTS